MFSFLTKAAPEITAVEDKIEVTLPEGCEALFDCEFAEISGAGTNSTSIVHMAL